MKVKFVPQNVEFEVNPDQSVMKLAHKNGIYIKSICGGLPSCAECRVRVVDGDQNVLPPSSKELTLIGTGYFIDQRRLSCQLKCFGDVTIDLTEQVAKQQIVETRRPQGSKKPENEASHAVSGNLIQQDETLKVVAEDLTRRDQQPRQGRGQGRDGQNRGGRNRNRGGQNRGGQHRDGQQQESRHGSQQQGSGRGGQSQRQNPNRGHSGPRHGHSGGGEQKRGESSGRNQGGRGSGG